jgi:hypothetical protein
LWNVVLGHGRAELADAAARQMRELPYATGYAGSSNPRAIELGEAIADAAGATMLIDALFGTGLARPLDEALTGRLLALAAEARLRVAIDLPSGVATDDGLIVPVIKGADSMNTVGLARAIADLAGRARAHQLKPDEIQGSTFTITNPGPYGSIASVPIINQPNTGILSFDAIQKRAVVIDDTIAIRSMVNISMSWDHRVIDGALASQFLARVKQNLETWDFAEDLAL